jgi:Na+/proline symporter
MASIMSGFVFVGGPGLFFQVGLSSFWIVISSSFTGALMCWVLAKPMRRLVAEKGCLTIPDLMEAQFGCRISSGLTSLTILLGVIGYLAVQIQALGVVISSLFSISLSSAILAGCVLLAFYVTAGGMLASVYSDVIQGSIMLWAASMVFYYASISSDGLGRLSLRLMQEDPSAVSPWSGTGAVIALSWFFLFSFGALGQPHVINKFMMVRELKTLRYFPLALALSMGVCGLIWIGVGISVRGMVLEGMMTAPVHPDETITQFLSDWTPEWLRGLTLVAIVAAIMSTADSFATVGAAALGRDLPRTLGWKIRRQTAWVRVGTVVLFVVALLCSWQIRTLVAYLGILAFGIFAAALAPAMILGLNCKDEGGQAVRWSIATGLVAVLGLEILDRAGLYTVGVPSGAVALALSFLVFIGVGFRSVPNRGELNHQRLTSGAGR